MQRYLTTPEGRAQAVGRCRQLRVTRLFLEGRRGDEYVAPGVLAEVRDSLATNGLETAGGIATVPGSSFGTRQNEGLGWLNWEDVTTQRDVAGFFRENAPVFPELIVDDFFCTGDTSAASVQARGVRSWADYRRDRLVSLVAPLMLEPTRATSPSTRLIIKFPQWYDRFHLFGYDPPRMAAFFDQVWVGTEVRNPLTRRMGYVQPTEGYMNFRWIASIAGKKVVGAWFDHIECTAQNFVDQAYLSVLAGARELTLFHLGDVMENHPGDALLAERLPELQELAARIRGQSRRGIAFYKPPASDADDNLYLADYLGMLGLPILPEAQYPETAKVVVLPAQAAADLEIVERMRQHLRRGATLVVTPAFLRRVDPAAAEMAGVDISSPPEPAMLSSVAVGRRLVPLEVPLDVDGAVRAGECRLLVPGTRDGRPLPWLTSRRWGGGRVLMLNVRTFDEPDFRDAREWLLAPKALGLPVMPQVLADSLRAPLLDPLGVKLSAPAGVALHLIGEEMLLYNFLEYPVRVSLNGKRREFRGLWPAQAPAVRAKPFSIQQHRGVDWLVDPAGQRAFSLGVCCVDQGIARENYRPERPGYAAWSHYPDPNRWAADTLSRLTSWGFTTVGGWSDFAALRECREVPVQFTPVLHAGSTAGAPWWDMWDPEIIGRMEQVARDQILAVRDDPRLLGYYSDNEMGWWNAALVRLTLDWFQYYDEPTFGREDGENFSFGLVDIHNRPYEQLVLAAATLDGTAQKRRGQARRPDAADGVPPAPADPLAEFEPWLALKRWDRERGYVKPASAFPMADLYLCWSPGAFYLGVYAQDVVEPAF